MIALTKIRTSRKKQDYFQKYDWAASVCGSLLSRLKVRKRTRSDPVFNIFFKKAFIELVYAPVS